MATYVWPYPRYLAHRGGGSLAPENTLAAFDAGLRHGYRAAEIDAVLSADGVAVLLHDENLDRTSNGRGSVARHSAAELALLDAGSWFGPEFAGEALPTLQQALSHCARHGIWLNVEIKPVSGHEAQTGQVVARTVADFTHPAPVQSGPGQTVSALTRTPAQAPLLSSFSRTALAAARLAAPQLPRALLCTALPPDWEAALADLACVALHCDHRRLDAAQAARVRAAGYGLLCYTVNDPQRAAQLRAWGVDAICTDRIDCIKAQA